LIKNYYAANYTGLKCSLLFNKHLNFVDQEGFTPVKGPAS